MIIDPELQDPQSPVHSQASHNERSPLKSPPASPHDPAQPPPPYLPSSSYAPSSGSATFQTLSSPPHSPLGQAQSYPHHHSYPSPPPHGHHQTHAHHSNSHHSSNPHFHPHSHGHSPPRRHRDRHSHRNSHNHSHHPHSHSHDHHPHLHPHPGPHDHSPFNPSRPSRRPFKRLIKAYIIAFVIIALWGTFVNSIELMINIRDYGIDSVNDAGNAPRRGDTSIVRFYKYVTGIGGTGNGMSGQNIPDSSQPPSPPPQAQLERPGHLPIAYPPSFSLASPPPSNA